MNPEFKGNNLASKPKANAPNTAADDSQIDESRKKEKGEGKKKPNTKSEILNKSKSPKLKIQNAGDLIYVCHCERSPQKFQRNFKDQVPEILRISRGEAISLSLHEMRLSGGGSISQKKIHPLRGEGIGL
jgi:hypothetical protein